MSKQELMEQVDALRAENERLKAGREAADHVYTQAEIARMYADGTWEQKKDQVWLAMREGRVSRNGRGMNARHAG
jgi:hypothetical protein